MDEIWCQTSFDTMASFDPGKTSHVRITMRPTGATKHWRDRPNQLR